MSSYLEKQSSFFRGSLASAATKISNPVLPKPSASLAPPSPSPSAASDSNTPTAKRKRDAAPEVFSQPQLTGYGAEVKTQMTFAVEYLKRKGDARSLTDIIDHLSLRGYPDEHKRELAEGLRGHPRVDWRPDNKSSGTVGSGGGSGGGSGSSSSNGAGAVEAWRSGTYEHRPVIPGVRDATSLLAHLQRKTDASGVSVKDLKDGWPDCEEALAALEREHRVLVVRTKKDNFPRYVWADDASLHHPVQHEFQAMWRRVQLPGIDDMHRKLVSVGQKPTSEDPLKTVNSAAGKPKMQKKRAGKRLGKATNTHMTHLLNDYSSMRR